MISFLIVLTNIDRDRVLMEHCYGQTFDILTIYGYIKEPRSMNNDYGLLSVQKHGPYVHPTLNRMYYI